MADLNERELFPDRGLKIEQGRVYQELAFGSTRPRGMMPGHLSLDIPERAARNIARRKKRLAQIEKCAKTAEQRREEVYRIMSKHRKRREVYLNTQQLRKFHAAIKHLNSADEGLRAPDKSGAFRDYSAIDKGLWELDELREWFNKNPAQPPEHPMFPKGYTMTRDELPPGARDVGSHKPALGTPVANRRARSRASARSTSNGSTRSSRGGLAASSSLPALGRTGGGASFGSEPHWADFEGSLKQQKEMNETLRRSGALNRTVKRPWKDRPPEEEGEVVPVEKLLEREKALYVDKTARAQSLREMKERTLQAQRGEGHGLI